MINIDVDEKASPFRGAIVTARYASSFTKPKDQAPRTFLFTKDFLEL